MDSHGEQVLFLNQNCLPLTIIIMIIVTVYAQLGGRLVYSYYYHSYVLNL